ncbi:hypothetical protein [Leptolyngbya sp. AN10]|uniref:hypothetical protein n=1 Tax=Leptolyngbya sp. AN10 TaxID=3423365 RepID=UPI003D320DB0
MARTKAQIDDSETTPDEELEVVDSGNGSSESTSEAVKDPQDIDEILNSLKTLLSTVEKLQKVRQEVGDIKPLMLRMLDGELMSGEDLEQLKTGVGGLTKLVRAHSDHQAALVKAQAARDLLDEVLKF